MEFSKRELVSPSLGTMMVRVNMATIPETRSDEEILERIIGLMEQANENDKSTQRELSFPNPIDTVVRSWGNTHTIDSRDLVLPTQEIRFDGQVLVDERGEELPVVANHNKLPEGYKGFISCERLSAEDLIRLNRQNLPESANPEESLQQQLAQRTEILRAPQTAYIFYAVGSRLVKVAELDPPEVTRLEGEEEG